MKIAIITDTHFGCRNDVSHFLDHQEKFFDKIFFPKLKEYNIDTIIHLGDVFDRRKYINFATLAQSRKFFFDKITNYTTYMIPGNHDTFYRNTNELNSISLLLNEYKNIKFLFDPTTIELNGLKICMIPWICSENFTRCISEMNTTSAEICMGHFEIQGFLMHAGGTKSTNGLPISTFKKFDKLLTGHYHHRSKGDNIYYLGSPYEMTWMDYADRRGFHIFDTETRELEFVYNPFTMFMKIEYDESYFEHNPFDFNSCKHKYIKILILNKKDLYKFDTFIKKVYNSDPYDVKILETFADISAGDITDEVHIEDTLSILNTYIESIETTIEKPKLKSFLKSLHVEAISSDNTAKE